MQISLFVWTTLPTAVAIFVGCVAISHCTLALPCCLQPLLAAVAAAPEGLVAASRHGAASLRLTRAHIWVSHEALMPRLGWEGWHTRRRMLHEDMGMIAIGDWIISIVDGASLHWEKTCCRWDGIEGVLM